MSGGYSIKVNGGTNNGKYISGSSSSNTITFGTTAVSNSLSYSSDENAVDIVSNTSHLRFNSASNNLRFRYFKSASYSGQKPVQLYKKEDKPDPTLSFTEASYNATLGQAFTAPTLSTDPAGLTVTYSSSNSGVAEVDGSTGAITLVGVGQTTITASFAGNDSYNSASASYTLNVIDGRAETTIVIDNTGITNTNMADGNAAGSLSATVSAGGSAISGAEVTWSGANDEVATINASTGALTLVGAGSVTFTATYAGDATNYKPSSQEVTISVNGINSISLDKNSNSVAYGAAAFTISATVPTKNYNGTVTATSNNTNVATVTYEGTTITVTPGVVGTAIITVTAGTGTYYPLTATATYTVTVTAPEGKTTAYNPITTVFEETFADCDGTGGNDTDGWNGSIANGTLTDGTNTDNSGWEFDKGSPANECAKFGTGRAGGSATTPALGKAGNFTLTFKAAAWDGTSENTTLNLTASNATIRNANDTEDVSSVTLSKGAWTTYTLILKNATEETKITFSTSSGNSRFFLDDVKVVEVGAAAITVKLNGSGYATFCSEYPLDFSASLANGYSAWQITGIDKTENTITFARITGAIKGGQGVLLKGTASTTLNIPSVTSTNTLTGNKLRGTLAPTYFADETMYGLSGDMFYLNSPCTLPANRAYIPASEVNPSRSLVMKFLDDTQGVSTIERVEMGGEAVYDLSGRRVAQPTKGMYIVNGKKVFVK